MLFRDRVDAGRQLADRLKQYANQAEVIVLGLPRGGVVTAAAVAKALKLPLDIIVPRKIGAPGNPEFAIGAVGETGEVILDERVVKLFDIPAAYIESVATAERAEAERRLRVYRANLPPRELKDKTAILVDDGVATGATMRAAVRSVEAQGAKKIIVATPVIAADTLALLEREADAVVYVEAPADFGAVGRFYEKFDQTSDEEVVALLKPKT